MTSVGDSDRPAEPVTWQMMFRFRAADAAQAERLARAWAGTIEAEFGVKLVHQGRVVNAI